MAAPTISTAIGKMQTFLMNFPSLNVAHVAAVGIGLWRLPQKARIMRIAAVSRADSGAGLAAFTIGVTADGDTLLSAANMNLATPAAGTYVEGLLWDPYLTVPALSPAGVVLEKEAELSINVPTHSGGGESATDVTVQIDYLPED